MAQVIEQRTDAEHDTVITWLYSIWCYKWNLEINLLWRTESVKRIVSVRANNGTLDGGVAPKWRNLQFY